MINDKIVASDLVNILIGGWQYLFNNQNEVNELNVFPVPDGDTGTNMCSTLNNMAKYIKEVEKIDMKTISTAMETGALKGAKGNSGVILSQIIKGMSLVFAENEVITTKIFAQALAKGAEISYSVVKAPKEGTILTVIRVVGEYAIKVAKKDSDFPSFFNKIIIKGNEAVEQTIEQLPELKKANVVDSGGKGLMYFIEGMNQIVLGKEITINENATQSMDAFDAFDNDYENITYTYCTEIWIEPLNSKTTDADIKKLEENLSKIGDSLIVVGDLQKVKIHVHTNTPNKAIEYSLKLGQINFPKIENMRLQYEKILKEREKLHKAVGTCAVCTGTGFKKLFAKELNVDKVVDGGTTMNPSVEDLVKAIKNVNADVVYVFPNNKNVILACERAKEELAGTVEVVVIKTKHMLQAISALVVFNPEDTIENNVATMNEVISVNNFFGTTKAAKNSSVDDINIKVGEYFSLNDRILCHEKDEISCVLSTIDKLSQDLDMVFTVTVYYGKDVTQKYLSKLTKNINEKFPDLEVALIDGGQELYDFFVKLD
ncbi:MAG: DAK2 domain-containing protein [Clostridia bacterium]|nr:DAK2 domain-containing protein [Clostridia bacterium]